MKIVTWNINSVRIRTELIEKFIMLYQPDVIAMQETKCQDHLFPLEFFKRFNFNYLVMSGEKSYNGVAIISKFPIKDSFSLKFYNDDKRHIAAQINDYEIHNFYIPAGGDEPDVNINPKFRHKLEYINLIEEWFKENRLNHKNLILVGDLNIAPYEHDVWSSKQLKKVVSHTDIEREYLLRFLKQGTFLDATRELIDQAEKAYSWWSYRSPDWQKNNRGRRLDHIWTSHNLKELYQDILLFRDARSWMRPSDHVPVMLTLKY